MAGTIVAAGSRGRGRGVGGAGGSEDGGFLVVVMVAVAVSSIALGALVQSWSVRLRRDKEEELIFRAQQYVKAILAYRKEHGGQFPINLEDLYKPGPRRLRYIRKLYRDPLAKDGRWGLLYLVPGGRAVVDVVVAQRAQQKKSEEWGNEWEDAGDPAAGGAAKAGSPGGLQEGVIPIGNMATGAGGGPAAGNPNAPVAMPQGPIALPPIPTSDDSGLDDEERVSEPAVGWPIVGVVSRAGGGGASASEGEEGFVKAESRNPAERTFKVYKGHEDVSEWQFHVFDFGAELPQAPTAAAPRPPGPAGSQGPGFGGHGVFRNFGPLGTGGPLQPGLPGFGPRGEGGRLGPGSGSQGGRQQRGPGKGENPVGQQIPPDDD